MIPLQAVSASHLLFTVLAVLAITLAVGMFLIAPHNSLRSRGDNPLPMNSVKGPILQLELARMEDDIKKILLPGTDPEAWKQNIKDTRDGNRADSRWFVPLYTLLLMLIGLLVLRGRSTSKAWGFWVFVAVAVLIAAFDYVENAGIEQTLSHIEENGGPALGDAAAIGNPGRTKWVLLSCFLLTCSLMAATSNILLVRLFAIPLVVFTSLIVYGSIEYFLEWRALT